MQQNELLKCLKGSVEEKKAAFDFLLEKAMNEGLEDSETAMLEFLKTDLIKPSGTVVEMSSTMRGVGGVQ